VALAVSAVLHPSGASAHEIGTTRVTIQRLDERRYEISVTTDAAALLARLEAIAGRPRSGNLSPGEYQLQIEALKDTFTRHLQVAFDGKASMPAFVDAREIPASSSQELVAPPAVAVRLQGTVPPGARDLSWQYDLTYASYAVTVGSNDQLASTEWLEGSQKRTFALDRIAPAPSRIHTAFRYFVLGFTHIVPGGLDHILFVLGVFLFSRRLAPILTQVSAFTVAHSITLGATLYGAVSLSPAIVEPMIALSIVYVAAENLLASELSRSRVALVFAFGLLHGMGFAGALRELGLPRSELLTGLVSFNAGVEAGQLTVIAAAFAGLSYWARNKAAYRRWVVGPGSALIALTGLYWVVVRLPAGELALGRIF